MTTFAQFAAELNRPAGTLLDGELVICGRIKDVIKRGGYSVYTVEVERALEEHPDVLEAVVVPMPDERDGEVPVAAVRLQPGASLESSGLVGWAGERLSSYKVPVRFLAVDELPRTGTHMVRRREVAALSVGVGEGSA